MFLYNGLYIIHLTPGNLYLKNKKTYIGHVFLITEVIYCSIFHSSKKVETVSVIMAAYVIAQSQRGQ